MKPFDIFYATFKWNGCEDMRPWLVIDIRPNNQFGCLPISSHCYGGSCFFLDPQHPDFQATGLARACYIHDSHLFDLPFSCFKKHKGALAGELLAQFRDYSGI